MKYVVAIVLVAAATTACNAGTYGHRRPGPAPDVEDVRPCKPRELAATFAGRDGATGTSIRYIALRNVSDTACFLRGTVDRLTAVTADGRRVELPSRVTSGLGGEPGVVFPGRAGGVSLAWYGRCDDGVQRSRPYRDVILRIAGTDLLVAPPSPDPDNEAVLDLGCLSADQPIGITELHA